jgi:hypothetical protein
MMRVMKGIRVGRPKGFKREVPLHKKQTITMSFLTGREFSLKTGMR